MEVEKNTQDFWAKIIKTKISLLNLKQTRVAKRAGISRLVFNHYLNRKCNLLPADLDRVIAEVGLEQLFEKKNQEQQNNDASA